MFDKYLNIPENYIPSNLIPCPIHKDEKCIFTIGETNHFVQKLDLCREDIATINEPYPRDKAVYFLFKNGVDELFEVTATITPVVIDDTSPEFETCPIVASCEIGPDFLTNHNIELSPYLDFKTQLRIVLADASILYTPKKKIDIITPLDLKL